MEVQMVHGVLNAIIVEVELLETSAVSQRLNQVATPLVGDTVVREAQRAQVHSPDHGRKLFHSVVSEQSVLQVELEEAHRETQP